ncbi:FAD-dependent tricarballylate dehydrogenase TcuA [Thiocystis violacea]|uniref:FAD-dependent tricarballylate dehydrogenase TcuA n=1 Tax=Thiocystis violacea TaxID=13725 RepID=UPI001908BBD9|nr:FAD-dependent tricarballylate dehydrogenase TcuA [Thiocystis violacea]MBK1718182.1 tricarballylate dehydrogenase [Thiocystis violacea]
MTEPDVLVIGGGTAALCAAISARRLGASVLLAEQAPKGLRGGNTRHSRNLRIRHESLTPLSSGPYPEEEFWSDLWHATGGTSDPTLARILVQRSAEATDWLANAGVPLQPTSSGVLPPSRKTAFLLGGGTTMLNALYATAKRLGVEIRYGGEVRDPRIANGRLERLLYQDAGTARTLAPRAAVACCGGGQANRDWLRAHWGETADGFINRGTPFASGEILEALLRQGARAVGDPKRAYLVAVDARSPADDGGIVTRIRCMPEGIVVDANGRRFRDEGGDTASTRYAIWGQRLADCPGQIAYLILDARGRRAAPPSLYPPIAAETIERLAARLGIDPGSLAATLAGYNAATRAPDAGADEADWRTFDLDPPKSRQARPLIEPPFAAYPMRPGITFTYHGVAVDAQTRVRLRDGGVIENLFAAGMIMAPNLMGRGYLSGLALTIGVVFGRIAGEEAARHAGG